MAGRHILRWGFAAALTVVSASATAAIFDIGTLADDSTTTIGNAAGSGGNSIDTWLFDIANNGTLFEATLVSIGLSEHFVWDLQDGTATSLASGAQTPWSTPLSLVAPIGLSAGSYSLQIENYAIPGSTYTIELVTGNGSADGGSFGGVGDGIGIPPPLPLPLPPAMLLMLTGLAGLGLVGSTRKG